MRAVGGGGEGSSAGHATADVLDALANSALLVGVDADAYAAIIDDVQTLRLHPGDELVTRGDVADQLFVVLTGQLEVVLENGTGTQQLSLVAPGAVVGEIGLLAGDSRSATVRAITASELAAISAAGFRRLLADHPAQGEDLARRATERLRRTQLIDHFSSLFGVIAPEALATVEHLMEWTSLAAGDRLFSQGDDGDAAYIVATGRLRAFRRAGETGTEIEIGEMGRGEVIGELALIDGEPRVASVYAVRDSQLIRFSRAAYEELLQRYPRVGLEVAKMAVRRARGHTGRGRDRRVSFVLVPGSPGVDVAAFGAELTAALGDAARHVSSPIVDDDLGLAGIAQAGDDDVGALRLAYHLEELEQRHRYLVYEIDETWTAWSRRALRWSDHVVVVADARDDPHPGALETELWGLVTNHHHPNVSLVLLHPPDTALPSGTASWLEHRDLGSHHHVRRGDAAHMGRLSRLLAGTALSLVLGGGGARGFAHLGVLAVLEELGQPIDMIAGTSIGSIMAVGPAIGYDATESRRRATEAFGNLFDYTLPTTALLRGERITRRLRELARDVDIADLWIPYFCVSTNLTRAAAEYHDRGSLLLALRASIAIPGVLPPVPRDGDLLVDGGVLANVPVDEMRRRNPNGKVLAIDVAPEDGPTASRDYGLSVGGARALAERRRGHGPPHLVATMVRSSLVASVRDRHRVVQDEVADLYVDVAVDGGGLLDFSTGPEIANAAAASTRPVIARWLSDESGANETYARTAPARRRIIDAETARRRRGTLLLTLRDLQLRATRFGAVIVGTSVVLTLLFLMTGLTEQFHREPRDTVHALGAEAWLLRDGASGAFTSAATMPADTADDVEGVTAAPVVVGRHSLTEGAEHTDVVIIGFGDGSLGAPDLTDGRLPSSADEVVIDRSSGVGVGEEILIGDARYTVTGRTEHTTMFAGMPLIFMPLDAAQSLLYRGQDLATAVLLDAMPPSTPSGFVALEADEIAEDATRPLERSISSVNLIRILLWFVAAMIIGTMTYLSALERLRDMAVLKAIGASTRQLAASIALQGALVALSAAVIASFMQLVTVPIFPLEVSVPPRALIQVPAIAVAVALLASVAGLRKAVRIDPALAFAGPAA
jgi:predicted acylesterase/phospholipase RssA/CRP-like cAMP-binding protein